MSLIVVTRVDGHKVYLVTNTKSPIVSLELTPPGFRRGTKIGLANGQFVVVREKLKVLFKSIEDADKLAETSK